MQEVLVVHGCALVMTAVAAVTDFRTGHIPNWLTLPPIAAAPIVFGFIHGREGFVDSALGMVLAGVAPFILFRLKAMAGGDVKLFAAIGAVTGGVAPGFTMGIEVELLSVIVAAVYALGLLAWNGKLLRTVGNSFFVLANPVLPDKWRRKISPELMNKIRLGVPIFIGTALAIASHHPMLLMR